MTSASPTSISAMNSSSYFEHASEAALCDQLERRVHRAHASVTERLTGREEQHRAAE